MRALLSTLLITAALPSFSDQSISLYGGMQGALSSLVHVNEVDGSQAFFDVDWQGRSTDMPPYYGLRYTNYAWEDIGFALDFVHSKAYASDKSLSTAGYKIMEFTDGLNSLTASGVMRIAPVGAFTPYFGGGLGINLPHVELQSPKMTTATTEYQFGGFTATGFAGASIALSDFLSFFSEVKFDYNNVDVSMGKTGNFQTTILTHSLNMGLSYDF